MAAFWDEARHVLDGSLMVKELNESPRRLAESDRAECHVLLEYLDPLFNQTSLRGRDVCFVPDQEKYRTT